MSHLHFPEGPMEWLGTSFTRASEKTVSGSDLKGVARPCENSLAVSVVAEEEGQELWFGDNSQGPAPRTEGEHSVSSFIVLQFISALTTWSYAGAVSTVLRLSRLPNSGASHKWGPQGPRTSDQAAANLGEGGLGFPGPSLGSLIHWNDL